MVDKTQGSEDLDRLLGTFRVPPFLLGPPPPMETRRQRGEIGRRLAKSWSLPFEEWPAEAQQLEVDELQVTIAAMERASKEFLGWGPYTFMDRIRAWWPRA